MRCIFHVLAAGSAFTVRAGSQSKKKTDLRQILTHTQQFRRGEMGESRVKGQRREREKNYRGGGEGEDDWGLGWQEGGVR